MKVTRVCHMSFAAVFLFATASGYFVHPLVEKKTLDEHIDGSLTIALVGIAVNLRASVDYLGREDDNIYFSQKGDLPAKRDRMKHMINRQMRQMGLPTCDDLVITKPHEAEHLVYGDNPIPIVRNIEAVHHAVEAMFKQFIELHGIYEAKPNYEEDSYEVHMGYIYRAIRLEVPKIWLSAIDILYKKLKIDEPNVHEAEIYSRRLAFFGAPTFRMTTVESMKLGKSRGIHPNYYADLFLDTAISLVDRMFSNILKHTPEESKARINALHALYKYHASLKF